MSDQRRGAAASTGGDTDIAAVGSLVADAARCRMLLALDGGRALPASRLAYEAGVSAATASSHLGKMTKGGLLAVEVHGRHRYYRLTGPAVGNLIEALQQLAPVAPVRSLRQGTRAQALRHARTCYDHTAGRLGVDLMASLIERGHLCGGDGVFDPDVAQRDHRVGYGHDVAYVLTESGRGFLADFGLDTAARGRPLRYCVDWSEQRHHLAGHLGRALRDRLLELRWVQRAEGRALTITADGREGLTRTFGIVAQPETRIFRDAEQEKTIHVRATRDRPLQNRRGRGEPGPRAAAQVGDRQQS